MSAMLLFVALASATRITFQQGEGSPTGKVIELLENLKTQCEEEGAEEATAYDKFACFCKEKTTDKVQNIEDGQADIDRLTGTLAALTAEQAELADTIKKATEDIGTFEAELAEMTGVRDQEKAVYDVELADATAALRALASAIKHISDSKSFLAVKDSIQTTLATAEALSMRVPTKLISLLQQEPEDKSDYEFKSGGILELLAKVEGEFNERKSTLESEEEAAVQSYDAAAAKMRDQIDAATESKESAEARLSDVEKDIAEDTKELTETTANRNDDQTYLKDITGQCEVKANEWDQRSTARGGEITALTKALEILGVAHEKAESTGSGGRSAPATAEAAPADGKVPVLLMSVDEDKDAKEDGEYSDVVFIQKSVQTSESATKAALRKRAITMLTADAKKLNSPIISLLTMQMAADPFAKVKTLIQGLIERLLQEAADEATHKGWCDTELGKANKNRGYRQEDCLKLNAQIAELEAHKAKLEETRDTLTEEIQKLEADLLEAQTLRDTDAQNNRKTLTDAGDGLVALKQALTVLKDFYRVAGRNKVLLEGSPVNADMGADGVDGAQKGAYKGNQSAATGIIGMLEVIQSDFERTIKTTEAAEHQAHRDFTAFKQESKVSIATKSKGLEQTENSLVEANGDLVSALNDLRDTQELLDDSLRQLEKLRPACVDTSMSWEEKVARREAEIEALKKSLCVLDEEDDEYKEVCASVGKLFLQK